MRRLLHQLSVPPAQPEPVPTPNPTTPPPTDRQTPPDWQWSTWREAAIQYKGIVDAVSKAITAATQTSALGSG